MPTRFQVAPVDGNSATVPLKCFSLQTCVLSSCQVYKISDFSTLYELQQTVGQIDLAFKFIHIADLLSDSMGTTWALIAVGLEEILVLVRIKIH